MIHNNLSVITTVLCTCLLQTGCGGGGSGSGIFQPVTVPFTSFDAIQANQKVVAEGISQAATVTVDTSTGLVTNVSPATLDTDNTQVTLGFDSSRVLNEVTLESPTSNLSWTENNGDTFVNSGVSLFASNNALFVSNPDSTQTFIAADPEDPSLDWNFQTFGVWEDTSVSGSTLTNQRGVVSIGRPSPVSGIPTSGNATYTGLASGFYSDAAGNPHLFDSTLSADANFATRNISFATSNTTTIDENTGGLAVQSGLNLNGNLFYNANSNQFSGSLTSGSGLSGTATGRFYGSNAEEIGGTFDLNGSGVETMLGGFGAKR